MLNLTYDAMEVPATVYVLCRHFDPKDSKYEVMFEAVMLCVIAIPPSPGHVHHV